jgi:hypothetical protein
MKKEIAETANPFGGGCSLLVVMVMQEKYVFIRKIFYRLYTYTRFV